MSISEAEQLLVREVRLYGETCVSRAIRKCIEVMRAHVEKGQ